MTIEEILKDFLGAESSIASLEDFAIVRNPSFEVIPNSLYRSPFIVAIHCRRGSGIGRINATTYKLQPHGFFIVLANQITELIATSADFEADYIIMSEEFTQSLGIGNTFNIRNIVAHEPYVILGVEAQEAMEGYITMCRRLIATERNPHRPEILRLLTRAFFLGMGYFLHEGSNTPKSHGEQLTEKFMALVEDNYRTHRDLAFYAERMHLTAKHLSTTIKSVSGKSATEWIEQYVVLDTITQLRSTRRTIKEIGYDLGFESPSLFGKYFRRVVGISPAQYRAKGRV